MILLMRKNRQPCFQKRKHNCLPEFSSQTYVMFTKMLQEPHLIWQPSHPHALFQLQVVERNEPR